MRRLVHPVRIRLAQATDIPFLPEIERSAAEAFRDTRHAWVADDSVTETEAYLPLVAARTVWVAADGDVLVGVVSAALESDALHVLELAVSWPSQRQGIGRGLVEAVIHTAGAAGIAAVTLTTFRDLVFNASFYRMLGFDIVECPPPRLQHILDREAERGLTDRCAMRLTLSNRSPTETNIAPRSDRPDLETGRLD